jgi:pimeloyl-ACP methyl ester carboxylesterase
MKQLFIFGSIFFVAGCSGISAPDKFYYSEIKTSVFEIAAWKKLGDNNYPIRIYIEGDGDAFNYRGLPTNNPTPSNRLVQELAFNDPAPNVVYIARPCQFIQNSNCTQKYWTSARFAPEIIDSMTDAIKQLAGKNPIILIGYSGGAQIAQMINTRPLKIITIAGVLNHNEWTQFHSDAPLVDSLPAPALANVPQVHFVGEKDKIVPPELFKVKEIIISNATHTKGWDKAAEQIYKE